MNLCLTSCHAFCGQILILFFLQLILLRWHLFLAFRALKCCLLVQPFPPAPNPSFRPLPALFPHSSLPSNPSSSLSLSLPPIFWLGGIGRYCKRLAALASAAFWWESSATRCLFLFVCFMLHCTSHWPVVAMSCKREAGSSNQRMAEN